MPSFSGNGVTGTGLNGLRPCQHALQTTLGRGLGAVAHPDLGQNIGAFQPKSRARTVNDCQGGIGQSRTCPGMLPGGAMYKVVTRESGYPRYLTVEPRESGYPWLSEVGSHGNRVTRGIQLCDARIGLRASSPRTAAPAWAEPKPCVSICGGGQRPTLALIAAG